MILCRYKDQMVFEEISKKYGVTVDRPRQVIFSGAVRRHYKQSDNYTDAGWIGHPDTDLLCVMIYER